MSGTMNVFCLLFAFVPLVVVDKVAGQEPCPNRTWDLSKDGYKHRCVHFCQNGAGWLMGYLINGTTCWYDDNRNGTCFNGFCYQSLPDGVTFPSTTVSTDVIQPKKTPKIKSKPITEPTTTLVSTTKLKSVKKKKKPGATVSNEETTAPSSPESEPETVATTTEVVTTKQIKEKKKKKDDKKKKKKKKIQEW